MKKLILLGLVVVLCLPVAVYAASIGGAETQGQGKFSIGMDQEFVFDRDLKNTQFSFTEEVTPPGGGPVEFTGQLSLDSKVDKMYRTMVKANYGLLDNLDVYVKLGTADGESKSSFSGLLDWTDVANPLNTGQGTFSGSGKSKTDNAFAYGLGMKGTYDLANGWLIGADAQYLRHQNDYKFSGSATYTDPTMVPPSFSAPLSWKGKLTIQEWQVAPYVAKKMGNLVPYFGVRYSDFRAEDKSEGEKEKYKADDNFGVFLGTDYKLGENWKLNLEGRFVDETAMSVGATYRF